MPQMCIYLTDEVASLCRTAADRDGRSISNFVSEVLRTHFTGGSPKRAPQPARWPADTSGLFSKPAAPSVPAPVTPTRTPREMEETRLWKIFKQLHKEGKVSDLKGWRAWIDERMADWVEPGDVDTDGEDV